MSQQATQPGATELDANIDALFNQLEPGAAAAPSTPAEAVVPEPMVDPVMAPIAEPTPVAAAPAAPDVQSVAAADQPDALLAEVSNEIEREAPAPVVPEAAFQAPSEEELQAVAPEPPIPSVNIDRLDAALAANADKALAAAQDDLAAAKPEPAPAPKPQAAKPKPTPAPAPPPPVVKHVEPEVVPDLPEAHVPHAHVAVADVHAGGALAIEKPPLMDAILAPLRPLAAFQERLGESTRQTIAYCAVLTLFSAACAWGLPLFLKRAELEPARGEQPFIYNDTVPAHGVTAPPRHVEPKAAAHGEGGGEGGGHGAPAKKDAHAKPAKKSEASGHGESGAAEKKTSSHSKKAAKPDEHGGH